MSSGYGRGCTNGMRQDACQLPCESGMGHWSVETQILKIHEALMIND